MREDGAVDFQARSSRRVKPISLLRPKGECMWHLFIENVLLHRWQGFKNRPRANILIVRAFLIVTSVSLLLGFAALSGIAASHAGRAKVLAQLESDLPGPSWYVLFILVPALAFIILFRCQRFSGLPRRWWIVAKTALLAFLRLIPLALAALGIAAVHANGFSASLAELVKDTSVRNLVGAFVAAVAAVYWQMGLLFNRQWQHCNDLYTEFLKASDTVLRGKLANALAHDLLVCDMWAIRSFENLFRMELTKAVRGVCSPSKFSKVKKKMDKGQLTEDDASNYLSRYEAILLEDYVKAAAQGNAPLDRPPAAPSPT